MKTSKWSVVVANILYTHCAMIMRYIFCVKNTCIHNDVIFIYFMRFIDKLNKKYFISKIGSVIITLNLAII